MLTEEILPMIRRNLSTSRRNLGLSDLYSRLTNWGKTSSEPAASKKKLFDPTKEKDSRARDELPEDSQPRKLRVLGKPRNPETDLKWVKAKFTFDAWPTNLCKKSLTTDKIVAAVGAHPIDYKDLNARFEAFKQISKSLGVAIPDRVLTTCDSPELLKAYLQSVSREYDEKQPDAIYLDRKEFQGLNITIEPTPKERRAVIKKTKQLIREAQKAQEKKTESLLQ